MSHSGLIELANALPDKQAVIPKSTSILAPASTSPDDFTQWRGIRHSKQRAADRAVADIIRQEKLEHVAAEIIQYSWRRWCEDRVTRARFAAAGHWSLTPALLAVHGPDAIGMSKPMKSFFVTLGWAANKVIRWWRKRRLQIAHAAARLIQNAWKWNRHRKLHREHVGAVRLQRAFRCFIARRVTARRRRCAGVVTKFGKRFIMVAQLHRYGQLPPIRHNVQARRIQRWYWQQLRRIKAARARGKGLRVMVLSLLFWVMNVNLKYLWGRRMIERNKLWELRQRSATLIQRTWVHHVTRSSMSDGWNYAKMRVCQLL